MKYICNMCKKELDTKDAPRYLVKFAANEKRVAVCPKCEVKRQAKVKEKIKKASRKFLPDASFGVLE